MKTRVITGLVLACLLIPLLFVHRFVFFGVLGVFTLIASYEMFHMYQNKHVIKNAFMIYLGFGTLSLYGVILGTYLNFFMVESLLIWLLLIVLIGLMLKVFSEAFTGEILGKFLLAMLYVGLSFSALSMVRELGIYALLYLIILAMVTDMFAYFVGVKFGRHRLAPKISPKKSIEGSIGGSFFGVLFGTIFALNFSVFQIETTWILILVAIFTGLFVSIIAQIGDLVASGFKREHDIKDFSQLFPGHGGVLDRFDSSSFAAIAFMIVMIIIGVL
ncbi:MAG: phosphatidate cytidylyltransferase [Candidatus Izemoplasmataceae bacterium]|jgi:phosphatidate cytidylyltransferase|uniref:phosphatidate cytidylyltransferase n=1 Tax=Liberiplasma polymorphum TaxID=3374570 RepID=UPI0037764379